MRKYLGYGLLICVMLIALLNGNQPSSALAATTDVQAVKNGKAVYYKDLSSLLYEELSSGVKLTKKVKDYSTKKWIKLESATIVKVNDSKNVYFAKAADADKYIKAYKKNKNITLKKVTLNSLEKNALVKYDKQAPTIQLTASATEATTKDVAVTVIVKDNVKVVSKKWAAGEKKVNDFATAGTTLTGEKFTASTNGTYTVYAKDSAGNQHVQTITVSNIDKTAPEITLSAAPSTTSDTVVVSQKIQVVATDDNGIQDRKWAYGNKDVAYFANNGSRIASLQKATEQDKIVALKNGVYTVYVEDKLGNKAVKTITINGISEFTEVSQAGVHCEVCRMDLHNTDPNKIYTAKAVDHEGYTHHFCRIGCMYHQEDANGVAFVEKYVRDYSATAPRLNNWLPVENAVTVKFKVGETAKPVMAWSLFHFPDTTSAAKYLGTSEEKVVAEKLASIAEYAKTNNKGMNYQYEVDKVAK